MQSFIADYMGEYVVIPYGVRITMTMTIVIYSGGVGSDAFTNIIYDIATLCVFYNYDCWESSYILWQNFFNNKVETPKSQFSRIISLCCDWICVFYLREWLGGSMLVFVKLPPGSWNILETNATHINAENSRWFVVWQSSVIVVVFSVSHTHTVKKKLNLSFKLT